MSTPCLYFPATSTGLQWTRPVVSHCLLPSSVARKAMLSTHVFRWGRQDSASFKVQGQTQVHELPGHVFFLLYPALEVASASTEAEAGRVRTALGLALAQPLEVEPARPALSHGPPLMLRYGDSFPLLDLVCARCLTRTIQHPVQSSALQKGPWLSLVYWEDPAQGTELSPDPLCFLSRAV